MGTGVEGAWRVCSRGAPLAFLRAPHSWAGGSPEARLGGGGGWGAGSRGSCRVLLRFLDSRKAPGGQWAGPKQGCVHPAARQHFQCGGGSHARWPLDEGGGGWPGRKEGPTASPHSERRGEPRGGPGLFGEKQAVSMAAPRLSPDPLCAPAPVALGSESM